MPWQEDADCAQNVCDQYINLRVVGQHIDQSTDEGALLYRRGASLSLNLAMVANRGIGQNTQQYWENIGARAITQSPGAGLWCDHSAGMIVHLLANSAHFHSNLTVIKQGNPLNHGHWWVLANWDGVTPLAWPGPFNPGSFTIDIWGAIRGKLKSSVVFPGEAIYDCSTSTANPRTDPENNLVAVCQIAAH